MSDILERLNNQTHLLRGETEDERLERHWEAMREAADEIERLRKLTPEWQPIETAPKNKANAIYGPSIMLWGKCAYEEPFIGVWHNLAISWVNDDGRVSGVTHWMPLPEPPRQEDQPVPKQAEGLAMSGGSYHD